MCNCESDANCDECRPRPEGEEVPAGISTAEAVKGSSRQVVPIGTGGSPECNIANFDRDMGA